MIHQTVVVESFQPQAPNAEVSVQVSKMLERLPAIEERLERAKKIVIKVNLGVPVSQHYMGRPVDYVDPAVLKGLVSFVRGRTNAHVLVGDGTVGISAAKAAQERGHRAIIEEAGFQFVDLHCPPFIRFNVPRPAMFRWYELSSILADVDLFVSVQKMKSHHLGGVTLSIKNLFGLPPGQLYGAPKVTLHSTIRLPGVLADLTQLFAPEICLIDGIVGCNYVEWCQAGADPVASGVLVAGNNPVATDAVAARIMGADPEARRGTSPFLRADNHIQLASSLGLGSVTSEDIDLVGEMPSDRKPFTIMGAAEPEGFPEMERQRQEQCKQAQWYFDDRDRLAQEYLDEFVVLGKGKTLLHLPIEELDIGAFYGTIAAEGLELYEVFTKLVQAEEAELREPYES